MSALGADSVLPRRDERADRLRFVLVMALLLVAGLLISGFTVLRRIDPLDEGVMLQAVERILSGQVPYRDFLWPYGPAQPYLLSIVHQIDGASLLDWRIIRVCADSAAALVIYLMTSSRFSWRWALAAWLVAILSVSEPSSANPFSLAMLASLVALGFAARACESSRPLRAAGFAGILCAVAAAWRPDAGVFALLATLATLLASPGTRRMKSAGAAAAAAVATGLVVYLPFLLISSPAVLYDALIGRSVHDAPWWRLPFVVVGSTSLDVSDAGRMFSSLNDLLGEEIPLILLIALGCSALSGAERWRRQRQLSNLVVGAVVLGCGYAYYMVSRSDAFHVQPLAVVIALLAPLVAAEWWADRRSVGSLASVLACTTLVCWGLVGIEALGDRLSALVRPPLLETVETPVADGVKAVPAEARSLPEVVREVQRLAPPGSPIFVAPRRSDLVSITAPVLYVLAQRPNPRQADLQLEALPEVQADTVRVLRRAMPKAIIRWNDARGSAREPNRRGVRSDSRELDRFIATNYRSALRSGPYEVLRLRR